MRIAFAGNPNSGKTTMYNQLTGENEKVGNWAGVTVDSKEAPIKKNFAKNRELIAVDLPGAYSMSPFTAEESITAIRARCFVRFAEGLPKRARILFFVSIRTVSVREKDLRGQRSFTVRETRCLLTKREAMSAGLPE